jgi:hypothetical protein
MKFKYRVTPGNILVLLMVCWATFIILFSKDSNEVMGASYLYFYAIFFFLGDLFLQFIVNNYKKVLLIEGISLPIIILWTWIS